MQGIKETDQFLRQQANLDRVDMSNPENAYTLWTLNEAGTQAALSGRGKDLGAVTARARQQVHVKNLWILPAQLDAFAIPVDDSDRVETASGLEAFKEQL